MIDQGAELSVKRQCELLGLNRTGVYYTPRPIPEEDLRLMRRIDEMHLEYPVLRCAAARQAARVGGLRRRTVARDHHDAPYGHRGAVSPATDQYSSARCEDLPLPARRLGDRATQSCVGRRSDVFTHGARVFVPGRDPGRGESQGPVISSLEHDDPGFLRRGTDRGNRPIRCARNRQHRSGLAVQGRWIDNVFIERLWRSVKYEDIYLRAYENGRALQAGLTRYFDFYNRRRIHSSVA